MPSSHDIARLARAFGLTMTEVRAMTLSDANAMADVVRQEQIEARRAAQAHQRLAAAKRARR